MKKRTAKQKIAVERIVAVHVESHERKQQIEVLNATVRNIGELHAQTHARFATALQDTLAMLDASSFGGQKSYRCLTPKELARLDEIRKMAVQQ